MARVHSVAYRRWVAPVDAREAGHYEFGQKDVPFTRAEELAWDAEELVEPQRILDRRAKRAEKAELTDKLKNDTITDSEIRQLLRLEHGFS